LFRFEEHLTGDPRAASALAGIAGEPSALAVMTRFAEQIDARVPPSLTTREVWRETAVEVGRALGVRGRALYHAIRVAVTAADEGPELDRLVPLIEEGSGLDLPSPVLSCARRARLVAARLAMMS
ncbi:MAG TPA: hypothetical protein VFP98_06610, partial [Candidatus Polarisedimenticolia bacterium]|nr:hypothetical protein [Candidatus Polarisedimenticolia bacterium]